MQELQNQVRRNWTNTIFLFGLPVLTVLSLFYYVSHYGFALSDFLIFLLMYSLCGLSITMGYHRYYSHKAFECHPLIQFYFLVFGAATLENSALCWVSDHRKHHTHTDQELDPYNIKKGFWWAHMGWILYDDPKNSEPENVADLKKSGLALWQHKYYRWIGLSMSFAFPALLGWAFDRPMAGLIWGGLLRQVIVHHSTFLINSAAHYFGSKPFSKNISARDSWWLALFSFGEGFHNFHHAYPSDYRNGVRWYHWDPTKWLVRGLAPLGLTWNLRTPFEAAKSRPTLNP